MEEIWEEIPGYEGLYQVSNFGNVRSMDRRKVMYEIFRAIEIEENTK